MRVSFNKNIIGSTRIRHISNLSPLNAEVEHPKKDPANYILQIEQDVHTRDN